MIDKLYPASITGIGKYLPEKIITNADLEKLVDTSDEWIFTRSGIRERRVVSGDETASSMAAKAALNALNFAGETPDSVDIIICATSLPDNLYPSAACEVQGIIGASNAAAFDLVAACSGFIYALKMANSLIASGDYKSVLIVATDVHSRFVNWEDRSTCVLFGDGAGAVLMQRAENNQSDIVFIDINADGKKASELKIPLSGTNCPLSEPNEMKKQFVEMNGREIYKFAVNQVPESIIGALSRSGITADEIDCYVLHQANARIISAIADKLKQPYDKFYVNLNKYGNTSSASIPIAIADAIEEGIITQGKILVLSGFGAGLTWGTAIIKWKAGNAQRVVSTGC